MKTAEQILAELKRTSDLAEKATKGPWKLWGMSVQSDREGTGLANEAESIAFTRDPDRGLRTFNANFIAAARTALPARDEALRVAVDFIESGLDGVSNCNCRRCTTESRLALAFILAALLPA